MGQVRKRSLVVSLVGVSLLIPILADTARSQGNLDKRLLQKTSLTGEKLPLKEVLQALCDKHKLKLELHKDSLAEEGLDEQAQIPLDSPVEGIALGSALRLILEPFGLTCTIDKGTLHVLTETDESKILSRATYPLAGLNQVDPLALVTALQTLPSGMWENIDGLGGKLVAVSPQGLTIEQTPLMHRAIADLLERTSAAMSGRRRPPTPEERTEDLIRRALARPVALPGGEIALNELDDRLRSALKINVVTAWNKLEDEGLKTDATVQLSDKKQPAGTTIAEALAPLKMAMRIRHEVLYFTTQVDASEHLEIQIYDARTAKRSPTEIASQVMELKELGPWEDIDGVGGSVSVVGPLVLIRQNAAAHEQLARQLGPGK
jgi:hypothetical protein